MNGRAVEILRRFPAHMQAAQPGKQLGAVVDALAQDLESVVTDLAAVRRAHRLGHADTLIDLMQLAALHGITLAELRVLFMRAERDTLGYGTTLELVRERVATICTIHAGGNGTVAALLRGASNALDLAIDDARNASVLAALRAAGSTTLDFTIRDPFFHSSDRFVHSTFVRDRVPAPVPAPVEPPEPPPAPTEPEIVGIIENPLRRELVELGPRAHAERFAVTRRGFGARELRAELKGIDNHCIGPMLVNRDQGRGFGFVGAVPAGETLVLDEQDRVMLGESDVTAFSYSFEGACFADAADPHRRDFVFDGAGVPEARRARFVVTSPALALDREAVFPRASSELEGPSVSVGVTRFAFFVQVAHMAAADVEAGVTTVRPPTPRTAIAFADGSVFAAAASEVMPPAAEITLSWLEHEAYAVRVLIPPRFAELDSDEEDVRARVRVALERFRPAGVKLEVVYQDERWTLAEGVLTGETANPNARLLGGTELWPPPAGDP